MRAKLFVRLYKMVYRLVLQLPLLAAIAIGRKKIIKDGDFERIDISGSPHHDCFHYPDSDITSIGLSDGTLLHYDSTIDPEKGKQLKIIRKGKSLIKNKSKNNIITFDSDLVDWIVFGERN